MTNLNKPQHARTMIMVLAFLHLMLPESTRAIPSSGNDKLCNSAAALAIISNISNIADSTVIQFVASLDSACLNHDVEYSEACNQAFFILLDKYPEKLIHECVRLGISNLILLRILENPIDDNIDIEGIFQGLESIDTHPEMKAVLLSGLNAARQKR